MEFGLGLLPHIISGATVTNFLKSILSLKSEILSQICALRILVEWCENWWQLGLGFVFSILILIWERDKWENQKGDVALTAFFSVFSSTDVRRSIDNKIFLAA